MIKRKFRELLNRIPYVKQLHMEIDNFKSNTIFSTNHFYSPIVSLEEIKKRQSEIWSNNTINAIDGVNLNAQKQLQLLTKLSGYYNELPFNEQKQKGLRYYYDNGWYSYTDAIILYSMMRHYKPKQIIEIGSGFSSSVMLDTNELFFQNKINLTFIEPNAERLNSLTTQKDKTTCTVIEQNVQDVTSDVFAKLESNDFLFVDSSHIVKTGSDVNHILFKILPLLKPGVIIHFHDVFFPFEYPKEWVLNGQNLNEDYFLKAFMMYNPAFEILVFADYLHLFYKNAFEGMPLCYKNHGGNFWIKKSESLLELKN